MKILKYSSYSESIDMAEKFLDAIGEDIINESDTAADNYKQVIDKIVKDLKLNGQLVLTFGAGMTALFPLMAKLVTNLKIEINIDTIALITLASVTIAYLEEHKESKLRGQLEKDSKSMLEELKMRGVGNGIIKKLVACIKSIGNIFKILFKHKRHVVNGIFDMLAYTSIAIPVLNAILYMVGKYDMNLETLPSNFLSLGIGVTTIVAKHGITYLVNLLQKKLKISKNVLNDIDDVDDPILKKYDHPEYIDTEYDVENGEKLIKEQ